MLVFDERRKSQYVPEQSITKATLVKGCHGAGLTQWWEHSPPTNVARVWFPDSALSVGVVCWVSTLLQDDFLRVLRFSPLLKHKHLSWYDFCTAVYPIRIPVLNTYDVLLAFVVVELCVPCRWIATAVPFPLHVDAHKKIPLSQYPPLGGLKMCHE